VPAASDHERRRRRRPPRDRNRGRGVVSQLRVWQLLLGDSDRAAVGAAANGFVPKQPRGYVAHGGRSLPIATARVALAGRSISSNTLAFVWGTGRGDGRRGRRSATVASPREAVVSSQPAETLLQVVQRGGLVERWRDCRIPWLSNCLATSG